MPIKNISFEELDKRMKSNGWKRKDFKDGKHYKNWYYRNHKNINLSGIWHIDHPNIIWYREN